MKYGAFFAHFTVYNVKVAKSASYFALCNKYPSRYLRVTLGRTMSILICYIEQSKIYNKTIKPSLVLGK